MASPQAVQNLYGPILVGVAFNIGLYGIMVTQTYLYFSVYKQDKTWMKLFVVLLLLCDTVNCCLDLMIVYIPLVNNFGNGSAVTKATWAFATDPLMTAIIGFLVQAFFAWRVKVLTSNLWAVSVIALLSFVALFGGIGTCIAILKVPQFEQFDRFKAVAITWLSASAVADNLITLVLVWHLRRHRTGMPITDTIINRVIRLTVQTGLLTSLCAIIDLAIFHAGPTGLHLVFNLPLSKLYTNSLMSSLNARAGWKYDSSASDGRPAPGSSSFESRSWAPTRVHSVDVNMLKNNERHRASRTIPAPVHVHVESHEMVDVEPPVRAATGMRAWAPVSQPHPYSAAFGAYMPRKMDDLDGDSAGSS